MAFIETSTKVVSFAEYADMTETDSRLFVANEALTSSVVEDLLVRSTARILSNIQASAWWRSYFISQDKGATAINTVADIPAPVGIKIKTRKDDFTDLCCYYTLYNYILPKIADFGSDDNDERAKISFYEQKYEKLFGELITAGDWYDFDGSGSISSAEKSPGVFRIRRVV
tara:strand:+ start:339 stop:851 length:513 start_codon:yes stop_codon:yes gene_type:complete